MSQAKRFENYINGQWVTGADFCTNDPSDVSDAIGTDTPKPTWPSQRIHRRCPRRVPGVVHLRYPGASRCVG